MRLIRLMTLIAVGLVGLWTGCASSKSTSQPQPNPQAATAQSAPTAQTTQQPQIPTEDMVLWLYATPEQLAVDHGAVAQWQDASGRDNHLVAPGASRQPAFVADGPGGHPTVRFDGENDLLMADGFSPEQLPAATVFIVATPNAIAGQFDALISAGNRGAEDSFTGFNIDLGGKNFGDCAETYPEPLTALNSINVQSAKTTVECGQDLLDDSRPLSSTVVIAVRIDDDEASLWLDGKPQEIGGGGPDTLRVPQVRLGARFMRQKFQGYYDGDISEVVVYGRSLSDAEIDQVDAYLAQRYGVK